ncbi:hypothetical protein J1N35_034564 [Gossypium stocksii]|uniref:Uncharacterized protein n=1 Tax=Gossypium stocksii TaxID=47602 RepID=A0A9D3ZQ69_9ROSI|nr:hypothetical protein J1N35_034564 [Gossypium stocksii]
MPSGDHYLLGELKFRGDFTLYNQGWKSTWRSQSTTITRSWNKAGIVMDARGLLGRERLLGCSKGDAPFGETMVVVIKQSINNYNHYRFDPSLTSTMPKHPLSN